MWRRLAAHDPEIDTGVMAGIDRLRERVKTDMGDDRIHPKRGGDGSMPEHRRHDVRALHRSPLSSPWRMPKVAASTYAASKASPYAVLMSRVTSSRVRGSIRGEERRGGGTSRIAEETRRPRRVAARSADARTSCA